jgi:hypothetical protein
MDRFGAALLHKFDDCVGIEILEGLHKLAEEVRVAIMGATLASRAPVCVCVRECVSYKIYMFNVSTCAYTGMCMCHVDLSGVIF